MKKEIYSLTEKTIDLISEEVWTFLSDNKIDRKNAIKIRLSVENILINWQNHFGSEYEVEFLTEKKLSQPYIQLKLQGELYDPVNTYEDDFTRWSSNFIDELNSAPSFSYKNGTNIVQLYIKKKRINPLIKIAIAFAAALIVGFLGYVLPEEQRLNILNMIVTPLYYKFIGVLDFVTVPFIFLSVLCGIYGSGESSDLSSVSKKLILRYISLTTFAVVIVATVIFMPIFNFNLSKSSSDISLLAKCYQLLLDIIPENIILPFSEANILQIVLIATALAFVLIALGDKGATARKFFDDLDRAIIYATKVIDKTIPFFVFIFIINQLWQGTLNQLLTAIKPIVLFVAFSSLFLLLTMLYTSIRAKMSFILLLKKMFPVLLIGISTASSSAIHGENVETCSKKYGINSKLVDFAIPMGMVTCVPSTAVNFLIIAIFFADRSNIEISTIWIINCALLSVVLAVATPPVAGGAIACYTLLFSQLGIPETSLALAVTVDVFFDFIATTVDNAIIQTQLILQTNNTDMLDREVLLSSE